MVADLEKLRATMRMKNWHVKYLNQEVERSKVQTLEVEVKLDSEQRNAIDLRKFLLDLIEQLNQSTLALDELLKSAHDTLTNALTVGSMKIDELKESHAEAIKEKEAHICRLKAKLVTALRWLRMLNNEH